MARLARDWRARIVSASEHRSTIGGALLSAALLAWISAAVVVGTAQHEHWSDHIPLGLIAAGGLCFVAAVVVFADPRQRTAVSAEAASVPQPTESEAPPIFPDVEFESRGTGFKTVTEDIRGLKIDRVVLPLVGVRMTNHEMEKRVSLSFHAKLPLKGVPGLDEIALFPCTTMPIDLAPQTSHSQDIEFDRGIIPPGAEEAGPILIEVEDHLSGLRTPLPVMRKWRPARDGKWNEGAFPTRPAVPPILPATQPIENLPMIECRGEVEQINGDLVVNGRAFRDNFSVWLYVKNLGSTAEFSIQFPNVQGVPSSWGTPYGVRHASWEGGQPTTRPTIDGYIGERRVKVANVSRDPWAFWFYTTENGIEECGNQLLLEEVNPKPFIGTNINFEIEIVNQSTAEKLLKRAFLAIIPSVGEPFITLQPRTVSS